MKTENSPLSLLLLGLALLISSVNPGIASENNLLYSSPSYVLRLSLNEFSILSASEVDGLRKYGGTAEFKVQMSVEGTNVVWTIATESARQIEIWGIYIGEKAVDFMREIGSRNIDGNGRIAMRTIASLGQKLDYARSHPEWKQIKLSGFVKLEGTNVVIQTTEGEVTLAGTNVSVARNWIGRSVIAEGVAKLPGYFEPVGLIERRTNTVELFVMSFCPYAQRAEAKLLGMLDSTNLVEKPKLEIHYIFYKQRKDGRDVYTSLHGDSEINEDLVQIILRDNFPEKFDSYVLKRAMSGSGSWQILLAELGFSGKQIDEIESRIKSEHDRLIQIEYNYVNGKYGITDGSPSYFWEGERVFDLSKVAIFKGLDGSGGDACNQ